MKNIGKFLKIVLVSILLLFIAILLLFGYGDKSVGELKATYATTPSQFISVDGMQVHYRDEDNPLDSLPLVLIHGTGASLHTFDAWTEQLKTKKRVLRMDIPGFGLTGPFPHKNYSIDSYATFINSFLEAKNIEKCVIGGNSLGGQIAWNFTVKYPQKIEKLILIDAAGYPFESESVPVAFKIAKTPVVNQLLTYLTPRFMVKKSVEDVYADKTKITPELVDRYFDLTLRKGNRQALVDRMMMENQTPNIDKIKTIQQPTLVLWGDQDFLIPVSNAHRFHEDLPNDTLVILKDLGHVPMEEDPGRSLVPVIDFLEL
ncbi:alpha/beta hydrolase [Tenacibaculum sp. IB213877]|uniref:alpha/beta fold hydrolase n=1 Tax=Tenacibaculum sp. IB213877 TaxID=3097351 RepID=UPI002A5A3B35|nr:alpha/beta hydrolase [Tenacibaculum sp. IB213877]MDY0780487.1 alpha/beta hydrolase [Tenacibaculum sp. IB213877]